MKNFHLILTGIMSLAAIFGNGQTMNWSNGIKKQRNMVNIHIASEYALTYGLGYGYRLNSRLPVILNAEYSAPAGNILFDDYKFKTGAQVRWFQTGNIHFASKMQGIFRRYNNSYARLLNVGLDVSSTAGYYKKHWFIAGELGLDKAIITHFKHSELYKDNYPNVKDGWYEPATGGHVYYNFQGGWSGSSIDIYAKFGKLIEQDLTTSPMLPLIAELGMNFRFGRK